MAHILLRSGAGVGRCQSQQSCHLHLPEVEQGRAPLRRGPTVLSRFSHLLPTDLAPILQCAA